MSTSLARSFASLSSPLVADACVRLRVPFRVAPAGIRAIVEGQRLAGSVLPARHAGSVDVFLEAMLGAAPGDVLVIDNGGRLDEGCIGDLIAIEARAHGLTGIAIWGAHRDSAEIRRLRIPVFSYAAYPPGPASLRRRSRSRTIRFGRHTVSAKDAVFADEDGLLFVPLSRVEEVLAAAADIARLERAQARRVQRGVTLIEQFDVEGYVRLARRNPAYTFREHLKRRRSAIEV